MPSGATAGTPRERLGKYELLHRIAVGGMGEVFLANETGLAGFRRLVVVKRLIPELAEQPELVELFVDEARIAGYLAHPNIVQIYELGRENGVYFLAMEYVAGQNVSRLFRRAAQVGPALSREVGVHVVAEMCRGLDFAHNARDADGRPLSIVHRDVSPHNVLVSTGGDVKLMDFGIAMAANKLHRTQTGVIRGKFAYMAPEQVKGDEVDARTDVFAAGVMLWEVTLGRRLFDGRNELETLQKVQHGSIPEPRSIDPDYPEQLEEIVLAALQRRREDRLPSAGAMSAALREQLRSSWTHHDEDELGAVVARLFPEVGRASIEAQALTTQETTAQRDATAAVPQSTAPATPAALTKRDTGGGADRPRAGDGPTRTTRELRTDLGERSRRPLGAVVAGFIALTAIGALTAMWLAGNRASEPVATAPAITSAAMDAAAPTEAVRPDAGQPERPSPADAGGKVSTGATNTPVVTSRPPKRPPPSAARPPQRRVDAGPKVDDTAPAPSQPQPPGPGTLVVGSSPWGTLRVDGKSYGKTDLQTALEPGVHALVLEVSEGRGSFRTSAVIQSDKKTRCRLVGEVFACEAPR